MLMESQVKFCSPQSISGFAAFLQTTEVDGDSF